MADIPSASIASFKQTSAPIGWTKLTTNDDCAVRITTGTTSTGGISGFSVIFTSITPTGSMTGSASSGSTTLDSTMIPSHFHTATRQSSTLTAGGYARANQGYGDYVTQPNTPGSYTSSSAGSGGAHSHTMPMSYSTPGFTGTALNMAVKYVDLIIAQRD